MYSTGRISKRLADAKCCLLWAEIESSSSWEAVRSQQNNTSSAHDTLANTAASANTGSPQHRTSPSPAPTRHHLHVHMHAHNKTRPHDARASTRVLLPSTPSSSPPPPQLPPILVAAACASADAVEARAPDAVRLSLIFKIMHCTLAPNCRQKQASDI